LGAARDVAQRVMCGFERLCEKWGADDEAFPSPAGREDGFN
jgi:hypothetical protein